MPYGLRRSQALRLREKIQDYFHRPLGQIKVRDLKLLDFNIFSEIVAQSDWNYDNKKFWREDSENDPLDDQLNLLLDSTP